MDCPPRHRRPDADAPPALIAHRGFADEQPENTIAAFQAAAPPADAIELDVRRCGTGEPVVVHDRTLDRLTNLTGTVADTGLVDLQSASVLGSGEGVPTLSDAFDVIPSSTAVNVELKTAAVADEAVSLVADRPHDVLVSSFRTDALSAVEEHSADLPTALVVTEPTMGDFDDATRLGCVAIHPQFESVDVELVAKAHDRGLAVNAWSVAEQETANRLIDVGVDGVIADRSDVLDAS